jgi:hypothetical protein
MAVCPVHSEYGHGEFLGLQVEASKHLLTSFYDTGVADDSLFTYHPVDFHVGLGYPVMAKLGLAIIVLVIAGVGALIWFIFGPLGSLPLSILSHWITGEVILFVLGIAALFGIG